MNGHPAKTLLGDRVLYYPHGKGGHVALVTAVHGDHCANLVYWCTHDKTWKEALSVTFGESDSTAGYFVNPEG
jgi:hypothetical protein